MIFLVIDLQSVDFVLSGTLLEVLVSRRISSRKSLLVQKCPTTDIIGINAIWPCSNYADIGYQFERLLTGRNLRHHDSRSFEILQLVKISCYTVLFDAEVDKVVDFFFRGGKRSPPENKASTMAYDGLRWLLTGVQRQPL